jgi:hypothetical protein
VYDKIRVKYCKSSDVNMNTEVNTNTVAAKLMNPAGSPPEGGVRNNPNFKTF